jgi:hypothetical protein
LEKVRVFYDGVGKTLCVWFGDPQSEEVCTLADDDTILIKNAEGHVIGFEKLNVDFGPDSPGPTVEVITRPERAA